MFEQLKGIEKGREEKIHTSNLDCLLDVCDNLVREQRLITLPEREERTIELYSKTYDLTKTIDFSEQDLKDLIFTKANKDYENQDARAIGAYTGILLQILNERKREEGKNARFYINGQGNNFNFLFYGAKDVGDLIVENFKGKYICNQLGGFTIGQRPSNINIAAGIGLEGSNAFSSCSTLDGKGIIIGKNIKGNSALSFAGVGNKIGLALAQDIEGDFALSETAAGEGEANFIFAENIKGNYCFENAGVNEGEVNVAYARNISGEDLFYHTGTGEFQEDVEYEGGKIRLILYDNISSKRLHNVKAKRIISHRNKKFPKLVSDYKIQQFFKLITPIDKVSVEGKFAILDQVKELYESIRHKARK